MRNLILTTVFFSFCAFASAQNTETEQELRAQVQTLTEMVSNLRHNFDIVEKKIDDLMWNDRLGDVAWIDKMRIWGPPRHKQFPTGNEFADQFLNNNLQFNIYTFIPKTVEKGKKYPLIVLPHSGIHSSFASSLYYIVREFVAQGYIVVAPDYRGSTGYGRGMYRSIDYGGLENEDALASRDYMVENYSIVDPDRIGIVGWSHGGMIALMNICRYGDKYACAFAGVPVSDVTYRLQYKAESYTDNFTPNYHIGQTPEENPQEYIRRSPTHYAHLLNKPLMIATTKNDNDVGWKEVQMMADSLNYHKKDFEYHLYEPMPGGHAFDRIASRESTEARFKVHKFLEQHLAPPFPFASHEAMREAAFHF